MIYIQATEKLTKLNQGFINIDKKTAANLDNCLVTIHIFQNSKG